MKNEFYSNCLIEALKAKLKDFKHTKIHIMFNDFTFIPHFWWENNGKAFNFTSLKKRKYQVAVFKGKIIERDLRAFKTYSDAQNYHVKSIISHKFHKEEPSIEIELDD